MDCAASKIDASSLNFTSIELARQNIFYRYLLEVSSMNLYHLLVAYVNRRRLQVGK
jgi:hypothetical protein